MRRATRSWTFPLVAVCLAVTLGAARSLRAQAVTLQVTPDSAVPTRAGGAPALMVVRNGLGQPLTGVKVDCVGPAPVDCRFDPEVPNGLPAGAAFAARLVLVDSSGTAARGTIVLELQFAAGGKVGVVATSLRLSPGRAPRAEDAATVELQGSLTALTDGDSATMYLIVRNQTDFPLVTRPPWVEHPSFLRVTFDTAAATLPPGSTQSMPFTVTTEERVQPGKVTLLFSIPFRWSSSGRDLSGQLITSREVEIGVLGQAEILKLLGLPSLLFLPGALVLLTCTVLWGVLPPKPKEEEEFWIPTISAQFVVLSITISLVFALLYRLLPGGKDYLRYYGLPDIAWLWGIALLTGVVAYAVGATVRRLVERWQRESESKARQKLHERTPAEGDAPLTVMQKLERAGEHEARRRGVTIIGENGTDGLFLLMRDPADASRRLIAPRVLVREEKELETVNGERLYSLLDSGQLAPLCAELRNLVSKGIVSVRWEVGAGGSAVRSVEANTLVVGGVETWILKQ